MVTLDWTPEETDAVETFLRQYFRDDYEHREDEISESEEEEIEALVEEVADLFSTAKDIPGLALDFLMVAEQISQHDSWLNDYRPEVTRSDVLERYENEGKDTLTLDYGGGRAGIRPVHNKVIDFFHDEVNRTNFPSAPGHRTAKWNDYNLMEKCFRLSRAGRFEAALRIFDIALERLDVRQYKKRDPPFPNPFRYILDEFDRSHPDERGGTAFQALAYGYVKTEWPHLSFRASKMRVGSSRQDRTGDIDGYHGPDLIISVEVKDRHVDAGNYNSELGTMMDLADNSTAIPVAICDRVDDEIREELEDEGVRVISEDDLREEMRLWDYHKQNRALQGMVHFYANIEENPTGTQRLLRKIKEVDPNNTALAHLNE